MICAYLDALDNKGYKTTTTKKTTDTNISSSYHSQIEQMIGGHLYSRFRHYVSRRDDLDAEALLISVKTFALDVFFKKDEEEEDVVA